MTTPTTQAPRLSLCLHDPLCVMEAEVRVYAECRTPEVAAEIVRAGPARRVKRPHWRTFVLYNKRFAITKTPINTVMPDAIRDLHGRGE